MNLFFARFPDQGVQGGGLIIEAPTTEIAKEKLLGYSNLDESIKTEMVNFLEPIENENETYLIMF